jgi:hypothetical protein
MHTRPMANTTVSVLLGRVEQQEMRTEGGRVLRCQRPKKETTSHGPHLIPLTESPVNISPLTLIRNTAMPRKDNANTPASAQAQQEAVSEGIENFELPRALVTRIAKSAVRVFIPMAV